MIIDLTVPETNVLIRKHPQMGNILHLKSLTANVAEISINVAVPIVGSIKTDISLQHFQVSDRIVSASLTGGLVKAFTGTVRKRLPNWITLNDDRLTVDLSAFLPDFISISSINCDQDRLILKVEIEN